MVISEINKGMSRYLVIYERSRQEEEQPLLSEGSETLIRFSWDKLQNSAEIEEPNPEQVQNSESELSEIRSPISCMRERTLHEYQEKTLMEGAPFEDGMLLHNTFQTLIPVQVQRMNGEKRYLYRMDGMELMGKYFQEVVPGKKILLHFLSSLRDCLLELEEYMLSPANLIFSINSIFYKKEEKRFYFLYVPGYQEDFGRGIRTIMESFMKLYDHCDKKEVMFLYDTYSRFLDEGYSAQQFLLFTETIEEGQIDEKTGMTPGEEREEEDRTDRKAGEDREQAPGKEQGDRENGFRRWREQAEEEEGISWIPALCWIMAGGVLSLLLGGTGIRITAILGGGMILYYLYQFLTLRGKGKLEEDVFDEEMEETEGEKENRRVRYETGVGAMEEVRKAAGLDEEEETLTQILNGETVAVRRLVSESGRGEISLSRKETRIGRGAEENDYSIEKPQISRHHALIRKLTEADVVVIDLGSTNGTYLNESKLEKNTEVVLRYGDKISFGGEAYLCV